MTAPLLAVDIGNTTVKIGLFAARVEHFTASATHLAVLPTPDRILESPTADLALENLSAQLPAEPARWFVSSVHRPGERRLADWLRMHRPADEYRVLTYRDVPLRIAVDSPERVGFDRLATAVAANALRSPDRSAVIVDVGTALKVHVVSAAGEFLGGAIAPGLHMAAKALQGETDLLPHVPVTLGESPPPVIGTNTAAAIRSGLYWGTIGAARELLARAVAEQPHPPDVFITGGDAQVLATLLHPNARFIPHLCLSGIALVAATLHHHLTAD